MGVKLLPMQGGKGWEISVLFRTKRGRRRLRDKGRVASLPHAESRNLLSLRRWTTWWKVEDTGGSTIPATGQVGADIVADEGGGLVTGYVQDGLDIKEIKGY